MRGFRLPACAFLALAASTAPAWAFRLPDSSATPPTQHQLDVRYAESPPRPYATTYGDEAARRLGIRDGQWEAFDGHSRDSLMPSLAGGLDGGKPMVRLQWRPDQ
jgi:hypothetical protein